MYYCCRYCDYLNCIVHCPPEVYRSDADLNTGDNDQALSLCDLPLLVLDVILSYLDTCSLRCLSATNKYLRYLCFTKYSRSAMVNIKWERLSGGGWYESCYVWISQYQIRSLLPLQFAFIISNTLI